MSIEASSWAWKQTDISPTEKLVLLCIADHADETGRNAFPSLSRMATKTCLNRRSILRTIKKLSTMGLLVIEQIKSGSGDFDRNQYTVPVQFLSRVGTQSHQGGRDTESQGVGTQSHPNHPKEPSLEEKTSQILTGNDLAESWNEWFSGKLPKVRLPLTKSRQKKADLRVEEHPTVEFWKDVFTNISQSKFLLGLTNNKNGHENWKCTFDFVIANDFNCLKIAEGSYD